MFAKTRTSMRLQTVVFFVDAVEGDDMKIFVTTVVCYFNNCSVADAIYRRKTKILPKLQHTSVYY